MAVPKKRTSLKKKRIRRNIWIKKGYLTAVKASSLAKSILAKSDNSKSLKQSKNNKVFGFGFFVQQPIQSIDID